MDDLELTILGVLVDDDEQDDLQDDAVPEPENDKQDD